MTQHVCQWQSRCPHTIDHRLSPGCRRVLLLLALESQCCRASDPTQPFEPPDGRSRRKTLQSRPQAWGEFEGNYREESRSFHMNLGLKRKRGAECGGQDSVRQILSRRRHPRVGAAQVVGVFYNGPTSNDKCGEKRSPPDTSAKCEDCQSFRRERTLWRAPKRSIVRLFRGVYS